MEIPVFLCALLSLAVLTAHGAPSQRAGYVWYALYPSEAVRKVKVQSEYQYEDSSLVWSNCDSSSSDVAMVTAVTMAPDPPEKGSDLKVSSVLKLDDEVSGGTMKLQLYYASAIQVMNKEFDICTLVQEAGDQCPLAAGSQTISFTETLPSYVPSGTYSGVVKGTDQKGNELACVNIKISV